MRLKQNPKLKLETGDQWGQYIILERVDFSDIQISYSVVDPVLQRHGLIKIFQGKYAHDSKQIQEFKNFAKGLTGLRHPHIVDFYGVAEEHKTFYVATDYIRGYSLHDWLLDNRSYSEKQAAQLLLQAVDALEYAAASGVYHLDLKPINFLVDWDNQMRVSNFGILQCRNILLGKNSYDCLANPHYVSPEQISGQPLSVQTDMYSLGAVLFHLMTGHAPFESETSDQECRSHLVSPFPAEKALDLGISGAWIELMEKLMQKKPQDRFPSYQDLRSFIKKM
jgi:serine/threonine-protein kinase